MTWNVEDHLFFCNDTPPIETWGPKYSWSDFLILPSLDLQRSFATLDLKAHGPLLRGCSADLHVGMKKVQESNSKQFSSTNLELQHRQALFCWVPWITDFADPKLPFTPCTQWGPSCIGNAQPKVMSVMRKRRKKIYSTIKFHEQKIYQICDKTNSRQLPPPQQALIDPGPEIDSKMSGQYGWICWQIVG